MERDTARSQQAWSKGRYGLVTHAWLVIAVDVAATCRSNAQKTLVCTLNVAEKVDFNVK